MSTSARVIAGVTLRIEWSRGSRPLQGATAERWWMGGEECMLACALCVCISRVSDGEVGKVRRDERDGGDARLVDDVATATRAETGCRRTATLVEVLVSALRRDRSELLRAAEDARDLHGGRRKDDGGGGDEERSEGGGEEGRLREEQRTACTHAHNSFVR